MKPARALLLGLVLWGAAGCPLPVTSEDAACATKEDCTGGRTCMAGRCHLPGTVLGAPPSSSRDAASGPSTSAVWSSSRGASSAVSEDISSSLAGPRSSSSQAAGSSASLVVASSASSSMTLSSSAMVQPSSSAMAPSSSRPVPSSGAASSTASSGMASSSSSEGVSSSGVGGSSSQAAVTLPTMASLLVWFRGDSAQVAGPTSNVAHWPDLSGRGNHATPPTSGPYVQAVPNANGIHQGVFFPGNAWLDTPAVGGGTKAITIFVVFSGANPQSMVRMQNAGGWVVLPWGNEKRFLVSSENGTTGVATGLDMLGSDNAGQWHLVSGTYAAAPGVFETRLDGVVADTKVALGAAGVPQAPLKLGALVLTGGASEFAIATVLEILIYETQLDERAFATTETYLMQRYGIR